MKRTFYHTRSLIFSIPLALGALGLVFVGPKGWFISVLLAFGAIYLSGSWRAIEIDKSNNRLKRTRGFLWFTNGEWEEISNYDKIFIGPETHKLTRGERDQSNLNQTSFNIYLINKAGVRYTLEKFTDLRLAMKNGAYYARTMDISYDMWKWPKRRRKTK